MPDKIAIHLYNFESKDLFVSCCLAEGDDPQFEEKSSSRLPKRARNTLTERCVGSTPALQPDRRFGLPPPPAAMQIPTSAETATITTMITTTAADARAAAQAAYAQLIHAPVLLPATAGGTSSWAECRKEARISQPPHQMPLRPNTSTSCDPPSGRFEAKDEEKEEDLVPEGHVADLAGLFESPAQINQSVNKYFML